MSELHQNLITTSRIYCQHRALRMTPYTDIFLSQTTHSYICGTHTKNTHNDFGMKILHWVNFWTSPKLNHYFSHLLPTPALRMTAYTDIFLPQTTHSYQCGTHTKNTHNDDFAMKILDWVLVTTSPKLNHDFPHLLPTPSTKNDTIHRHIPLTNHTFIHMWYTYQKHTQRLCYENTTLSSCQNFTKT